MLAPVGTILRGLQGLLKAFGFAPRTPSPAITMSPFIGNTQAYDLAPGHAPGAAPIKLFATIEIVPASEAPVPPDGGTPTALPLPVLAQNAALSTMYRSERGRPLAAQLAITAARNVPKGRKPSALARRPALKPSLAVSGPRRASALRAKPVLVDVRKKSLKRRHVWLSNQSRVIRTITSNVIQMHIPRTHRGLRSNVLKGGVRPLKLAA